jgi:hypothetical protein
MNEALSQEQQKTARRQYLQKLLLNEAKRRIALQSIVSQFHQAARLGDLKTVSLMLTTYAEQPENLKILLTAKGTDFDKTPILSTAIINGHSDIAMAMLNSARDSSPEIMHELLTTGSTSNKLPLHHACHKNHAMVHPILKAAAKDTLRYILIHKINSSALTPLLLLSKSGNVAATKKLLDYSHKVGMLSTVLQQKNRYGFNALVSNWISQCTLIQCNFDKRYEELLLRLQSCAGLLQTYGSRLSITHIPCLLAYNGPQALQVLALAQQHSAVQITSPEIRNLIAERTWQPADRAVLSELHTGIEVHMLLPSINLRPIYSIMRSTLQFCTIEAQQNEISSILLEHPNDTKQLLRKLGATRWKLFSQIPNEIKNKRNLHIPNHLLMRILSFLPTFEQYGHKLVNEIYSTPCEEPLRSRTILPNTVMNFGRIGVCSLKTDSATAPSHR